ncbi:hypothetical protein HDV05_000004 [Chytridiales sp. JEL 0842]|nr:hypothetical protein HDV05_000004 [Chytridiales sp. JEL 0842]
MSPSATHLPNLDTNRNLTRSNSSSSALSSSTPNTSLPTPIDGRKKPTKMLTHGLFRFEDQFWGTGENPTEGVRVLHEVFTRHLNEVEDLIALVKVRVQIEETTATRLGDLGKLSGAPGTSSVTSVGLGALFGGGGIGVGVGGVGSRLSSRSSLMVGGGSGSPFVATGNGITSIGSTPVSSSTTSGNILNGISVFAKSVASAGAEWAQSVSTAGDKQNSDKTGAAAGAMIAGGGVGSSHFGSVPMGSGSVNSPMSPASSTAPSSSSTTTLDMEQSQGLKALSSDAANISAAGATGYTEDASSLIPVVRTLREQMMAMASIHRRHADTLTLSVLSPLTAFVDQHRRALNKKKAEVDASYKELSRIASDIEAKKLVYFTKSRIADEEEVKFRMDGEARSKPADLGPILFGSRSVGPQEFHDMVNSLKREVNTKSILTPLGLYEGCFIGDDALAHLQTKYPKVPRADIRILCQEMVTRRLISAVVGGSDYKFSGALPYMFGRQPLLKNGEPPHIKGRKDAEIAKLEYLSAVEASEHTRGALEFHITDYLNAAQEAETYRLTVAKEVLAVLESAQTFVINEMATSWSPRGDGLVPELGGINKSQETSTPPSTSSGRTTPSHQLGSGPSFLESPDTTFGVQHIASRYRTGHMRTPPFVFESYKDGRAPHQVFGISLDELASFTGAMVPSVVVRCVGSLFESFQAGRSGVDTWIMPNTDLPTVQFLRHEMNKLTNSSGGGGSTMKRYQPAVVAGVLRLYFVEAPVSLVTHEIYEPLKMLYSQDVENFDSETKLKSVVSLLKTLSPAHWETLKVFAGYLHEIVKPLDPTDDRIPRLCWSLAPTILRPKQETKDTITDEHPWLFTRDLVLCFPDILGEFDIRQATTLARTPSPQYSQADDEEENEERGEPRSVVESVVEAVRGTNRQRKTMSIVEMRAAGAAAEAARSAELAQVGAAESQAPPAPVAVVASPGADEGISTNNLVDVDLDDDSESKSAAVTDSEDEDPSAMSGNSVTGPVVVVGSGSSAGLKKKSAGWFPWGRRYTQALTEGEGEVGGPQVEVEEAGAVVADKAETEEKTEAVVVESAGASDKNEDAQQLATPPPTPARLINEPETADVSDTKKDEMLVNLDTIPVEAPSQTSETSSTPQPTTATRKPSAAGAVASSIASIGMSVMYGTAAAVAAAVTKTNNAKPKNALSTELEGDEEEEEVLAERDASGNLLIRPLPLLSEDEAASVWAEAASFGGQMAAVEEAEEEEEEEEEDGDDEDEDEEDEEEEEEPQFFDGTEVEDEVEHEQSMQHFPSSHQDLEEYLQWG